MSENVNANRMNLLRLKRRVTGIVKQLQSVINCSYVLMSCSNRSILL